MHSGDRVCRRAQSREVDQFCRTDGHVIMNPIAHWNWVLRELHLFNLYVLSQVQLVNDVQVGVPEAGFQPLS